jgi:signal transduction histidine kinase
METMAKSSKISAIAILTAIIAALHYIPIHASVEIHIIHRELFTIPILLAGFWFGLKFALGVSICISLIYTPQMLIWESAHMGGAAVFTQIVFFNLIAFLVGWMVERQKKQGEKLILAEKLTVLGRAASAMAYEIKNIVEALKKLTRDAGNFSCTEFDVNFHGELQRLDHLVDNLTSYVPQEEFRALSSDLNQLIRQKIAKNREKARQSGVIIESDLDEAGCPSMVDVNKIGWVLDILITNALEFSAPGQKIQVRSLRKGTHCEVQVQDQGEGINPEHLHKIFKPFFTTKKDGSGLSLASCKKILRDMGGDIRVSSISGKGATFTIVVPREKKDKPYREKVLAMEKALFDKEKIQGSK